MTKNVIGIIPARGGSRGISRKNLRELGGLPLVSWALRAGVRSTMIDKVVLSTEDDEIARIGQKEGALVHIRPLDLATDTATTLSVLHDVLVTLEKDNIICSAVVLLEPTSPFRTLEFVDSCIKTFFDTNAGTVISVTQLDINPSYIFSVEKGIAKFFIDSPNGRFNRRQDFPHLKRTNGCIHVHRAEAIKCLTPIIEPIHVIEMSPELSLNIDTPIDLDNARLNLRKLQETGIDFSDILDEVG
jgi:CMP-N-acetylneuraminic acid synthetase